MSREIGGRRVPRERSPTRNPSRHDSQLFTAVCSPPPPQRLREWLLPAPPWAPSVPHQLSVHLTAPFFVRLHPLLSTALTHLTEALLIPAPVPWQEPLSSFSHSHARSPPRNASELLLSPTQRLREWLLRVPPWAPSAARCCPRLAPQWPRALPCPPGATGAPNYHTPSLHRRLNYSTSHTR